MWGRGAKVHAPGRSTEDRASPWPGRFRARGRPGRHLALALPPPPYAQFPSFGRPAGRTRGRKGTTAAASSAEQGEWTPCEPSSPSQPSKVTSEAHPVAFDHPTPPVQQASTPPFGAPLASTALRTPDFAPGRWWVGVRALVRVVGRRRASTAGELATNHQPHHHHLRPDLRRIDRDDPGLACDSPRGLGSRTGPLRGADCARARECPSRPVRAR